MRRVTFSMITVVLLVVAVWGVVVATSESGPGGFHTFLPLIRRDAPSTEPRVNLWMSTGPQGSPMVSFPSGTKTLYAVLEYSNLPNQSVRVNVTDDGNIVLLDDERTYSGSGQREFQITGSGILAAYQDAIQEHGQGMTNKIAEAQQYVRPGATVTETLAITPTIQAAVTEADLMKSALERVRDRFTQPPERTALLNSAVSALEAVITAGKEATQADRTLDEMRDRVNTMSAQGAQAVEAANQARYDPPAGLNIPETPSCRSNVSNLYLGSRLAATVEWLVGNAGSPHQVEVVASPSSVYATSVEVPGMPVTHTATIKATVKDIRCRPVPGVVVNFVTNNPAMGTLLRNSATTLPISTAHPGLAQTTLIAGNELGNGTIIITATAGSAVGSEHVTLVGPAAGLQVRVSRKYMAAAGEANLVVADVRDTNNWPVVDGTPVTFSVDPTTFGIWSAPTTRTSRGLASSYLNPGLNRGRATVQASVGGLQSEPVEVWIVGPADTITITAEPATINITLPSAFSTITAHALDDEGNPAPDGTMLRFEIDNPSLGGFEGGDPARNYGLVDVPLSVGVATAKLFAKGQVGEAEIQVCVLDRARNRCQLGGPVEFTTVQFVSGSSSMSSP